MVDGLQRILAEADRYFMGRSQLHEAALKLARIFDDMGITYAIAGALALAAHGRRRMTEDVDVLIAPEDLLRFKAAWLGRGYVEITPDLMELVRARDLPREFGDSLDPSVRSEFDKQWRLARVVDDA